MKIIIDPELIWKKLKKGKISEKNALDLLMSLLNYSNNPKIRSDCLKYIAHFNILKEERFQIIETHLIADTDQMVRLAAAKALALNFPKKSVSALKNRMKNENSPLVVKYISDLFRDLKDTYF
jgi:HEAT repeat protein